MQHPQRASGSLELITTHPPLSGVISLPPRLERGAALLCFLHGRGEAQPLDTITAMTMHGPLNVDSAIDADGLAMPFVVVAPQLPIAGDHWHEQADRVLDLVRQIEACYATDPARRYLTGFSFGGNGVFDFAHRQPGDWAALWPVDPTRIPEPDLVAPLWLSIGSSARPVMASTTARLGSTALVPQATEALAGSTRVHLDQGEGHVETAQKAYADVRIYRWLWRHRHS